MKLDEVERIRLTAGVAPYVGAWIETMFAADEAMRRTVAPYVGAWIETATATFATKPDNVAPYVGAWIETPGTIVPSADAACRPLRRGVD